MDAITFQYLISLTVFEELDMHLMDISTTYLYVAIDIDIYMKLLKRFKLIEATNSKP